MQKYLHDEHITPCESCQNTLSTSHFVNLVKTLLIFCNMSLMIIVNLYCCGRRRKFKFY